MMNIKQLIRKEDCSYHVTNQNQFILRTLLENHMISPSLSTIPPPGTVPTMYVAFLERQGKSHTLVGMRMEIPRGESEKFTMKVSELSSTFIQATLCQGQVHPDYVKQQVRKNDIFFIVFYEFIEQSARRRVSQITVRIPAAFVIARIIDDNELYIDVICAGPRNDNYALHNGKMMIDMAKHLAKERGLEQVTLSALPPVLSYYPNFGFAHRHACDQPPDMELLNKVRQLGALGKLPKTIDEAYTIEEFVDYMSELQIKNYGNKYEDDCSTSGKSIDEIKASIKRSKCANDGFKMRFCLNDDALISSINFPLHN